MTPRLATQLFVLLTVVAWCAWDLTVYRLYGPTATISDCVWEWCTWCPAIPLVVGMVLWHLFGVRGK